jgi:SAM-dependent methyltransferase
MCEASERPDLQRWNQRFLREDYLFGTEQNAFLAGERGRLRAGQRALAIADGEGRNGVWLAMQGLDVLSIDFSSVALKKAAALASERGVSLKTQVADLDDWTWQADRFDVVAAIFIQFAGPKLRERIFAGICRTLAPGGLLLLQGYRPEQLAYGTGGPSQAENMYTASLLRSAFAELDILRLKEHDSVVHEGTGHDGMAALVDLVARKPG